MNRNIFFWGLYDFANSFVMITFLFYFSQWLVIDQGRPAWWYNGTLIASSLLFVLTAPFASRMIDLTGRKARGLRFWTGLSIAAFAAISLIALLSDSFDMIATALYAFATYAYLMCFVYFTPILSDLSSDENRSYVSGIGQGMNYAGQVASLLVILPFATGALTFFGAPGRAQTLLPATFLFAVLALPMLVNYRDEPRVPPSVPSRERSVVEILRIIVKSRSLFALLLSYFFFSDALLTFSSNFPLYLEKVFGVPDLTKALLTAAILLVAAIGAYLLGRVADRTDDKKVLVGCLILYCLLFPALALAPTFEVAAVVSLLAGTVFAAVFGVSRAMVGRLSPSEVVASSYNYYTLAERFATFIGPATWSVALLAFGQGPTGYRAAIFAMGVLVLIGLVILLRVHYALSQEQTSAMRKEA